MRRIIVMLGMVGLLAACRSNETIYLSPKAFQEVCKDVGELETSGDASNTQKNVIGVGMQVSVAIAEDASLNRVYPVPPNCMLDLAAAGRVKVCGLTTDELATKIKATLERDYFTHATVTVAIEGTQGGAAGSFTNGVVYVLGEVGRPGPLQLPAMDESFTVTKLIIAAGGFTTFAQGSHVRIIRYCGGAERKYETFVNVERIMKKGEFESDIPVRPNDWVIVPQKMISFF
ncbi:MAG: polysaccharide biosynthesis/export family protein [Verrucomicrobiota bacterium]|jgi:protein involved in polysaccharide export with SLBB domain